MTKTATTSGDAATSPRKSDSMIVVASSSLAGTTVEWYDFFLYGTASALVFNRLFFPGDDLFVSTMLAFGTFAAGFIARPLGAIVLGYLGDRKGRKATLITTLLLMGAVTALIALIPPYAQIGVWAPILLLVCRLCQGFALGGEWSGAVLLVSEHGNESRWRAFWSAFPNMGPPLGNLLAAGVLALLSATLSPDDFLAWGWRIAFGLSAILVLVGLILRLYVHETPLFEAAQARAEASDDKRARGGMGQLLKLNWKELLIATGTRMGENAGFYIYSLFLITYATEFVHVDRPTALGAVMIGQGVAVVLIPAFAFLADKVGRKPILYAATLATIVFAFAFFWLLDQGTFASIATAAIGGLTIFAAYSAVIGAFYSELFPTNVRYLGTSVAYNAASLIAGGLSPIIALALYQQFGTGTAIAAYLAGMGVISLVSIFFAKETKGITLSELDA